LREIAARPYHIPSSKRTHVSITTLRRYLQTYRDHGFEALRPSPRADAGTPRAFPPHVLARAVALREEQPARTTQTLVDILQRDESLTLPRTVNVHTLTTHLRKRGKTRRLLGQATKVYRRFERDHVNSLPWHLRSRQGRCGKATQWSAPGCPTPRCRVANAARISSALHWHLRLRQC
jgi:hypothetical protein